MGASSNAARHPEDADLAPQGQRPRVVQVIRGLGSRAASAAFDRLIHERVRLGVISALAVNESLTFSELRTILQTTDGNLSVHARKLEEGGYIACTKSFEDRIPRTQYRLTQAGRQALERYLEHMEALVQAVRGS